MNTVENTITRNEIKDCIDRGENVALVEALPENFYESGHLPGAVAIPVGAAATLASALLPDKKQTVIVYCSGSICQNSGLVVQELKGLGYADVRRYVEGKEDWQKAGLPLEKSKLAAGAGN